jgi:hypothetical protein
MHSFTDLAFDLSKHSRKTQLHALSTGLMLSSLRVREHRG